MVKSKKNNDKKNINRILEVRSKSSIRENTGSNTKNPQKEDHDIDYNIWEFRGPVVNELKDLYENGDVFDRNWSERIRESGYILEPNMKKRIMFWESLHDNGTGK